MLVDTPGIGENEFLESELMNFISENTILGFMYIIKTDNAGGVQEDRVRHYIITAVKWTFIMKKSEIVRTRLNCLIERNENDVK